MVTSATSKILNFFNINPKKGADRSSRFSPANPTTDKLDKFKDYFGFVPDTYADLVDLTSRMEEGGAGLTASEQSSLDAAGATKTVPNTNYDNHPSHDRSNTIPNTRQVSKLKDMTDYLNELHTWATGYQTQYSDFEKETASERGVSGTRLSTTTMLAGRAAGRVGGGATLLGGNDNG